ncbi:tRNA 5-methoxyuridine(34)/uridine 5-oxyacetic acid(34) synthase CmoB [Campylobacter volucris]|uniref:tRNA 5-methoxyuridine(34)/uridine 5-oxyacetic acid(34) synthase CmoB n=1 Tax=Campylobacter volucris TaxID=1031542 RepID=A0A5C7E255_9BACT|nr:tRNA 5-methoxyuridine(34)/uridine 5-oxyacetic acid(34) synthase CmoB [Campylobacter volucris]TXE88993.1 tRNA 5-methoxyuridine(34)/uridine 5-oxyacetic acid(34) synthase CmoB [Campylobacter volucris]
MQENILLKQAQIHPLYQKIQNLHHKISNSTIKINDSFDIFCGEKFNEEIKNIAIELKPWRKGPFRINDLFIDTEWRSFIKFNILKEYMHCIENKIVADIGCNNGYYMFKMLEFNPAKIIGFDPSIKYFLQFLLINSLAKTSIKYELLGVADVPNYPIKFDVIFCLGVIYHRSDPVMMLKQLKQSLNKNGIVFLDTMYIEDEREIALIPKKTYSKIPNIFFIPSILGLRNWCQRAGFSEFEILATKQTDLEEQRKTQWIDSYSLDQFLDEKDSNLTCEGYPAPKRVYVRLKV